MFKFVRLSSIDALVTYKPSRGLGVTDVNILIKQYVKLRKLGTWKKFTSSYGSVVGKQILGSVVAHPFSRLLGGPNSRLNAERRILEKFGVMSRGVAPVSHPVIDRSGVVQVSQFLFGKYHRGQ
jgi:hypothetical protein